MTCKAQIEGKLKSERGATILVALLFFLMCAMVGSVILAAATVSSGVRAGKAGGSLTSEERIRYSLTIASEKLNEEFSMDSDRKTLHITWNKDAADNWQMTLVNAPADPSKKTFQDLRLELAQRIVSNYSNNITDGVAGADELTLMDWQSQIVNGSPVTISTSEFTLNLTDTSHFQEGELLPVKANVTMDQDFNMLVTLNCDVPSLPAAEQSLSSVKRYVYFREQALQIEYNNNYENDQPVSREITLVNEWQDGDISGTDPSKARESEQND